MKKEIINNIIKIEGGYVNDPSDSGGETKFGVTVATAREFGITKPIIDLTEHDAFTIYEEMFWKSVNADEIFKVDARIAQAVVDYAVHSGPNLACKTLQRLLNTLNNAQSLFDDLSIDGVIGSRTISALHEYAEKRNMKYLIVTYDAMRINFLVELVERREKDERFLYGWLKRVIN